MRNQWSPTSRYRCVLQLVSGMTFPIWRPATCFWASEASCNLWLSLFETSVGTYIKGGVEHLARTRVPPKEPPARAVPNRRTDDGE